MEKITFIIILLFAFLSLQAQNYENIFEGNGAITAVDTVEVQNITQKTSLILNGDDTLNLVGVLGTQNFSFDKDKVMRIFPKSITNYSNIDFRVWNKGLVIIEIWMLAVNYCSQNETTFRLGRTLIM
ncbi:MAG: hypothetical protein ACI83B_003286 [Sediminicola sp.]|jgi:hypothetical protein